MQSKYYRTPSLDKFVGLLYTVAQTSLTSREPAFMHAFRNSIAAGQDADAVIDNVKHMVKGEIPEWTGLLDRTYEVELYFVKLEYAIMLLSIDPPKDLTGKQPLGSNECFQYHMDSYFHVLFGLLDRLKRLVTYLHRKFIPQIYSSCDHALILKEQSILKQIEHNIRKNKNLVAEYRSPMAHYRSPGVEALDEEKFWYIYLGLPKRLDLVEMYYLPVAKHRRLWTEMLDEGVTKVYTFIEDVFSILVTLDFLKDINGNKH